MCVLVVSYCHVIGCLVVVCRCSSYWKIELIYMYVYVYRVSIWYRSSVCVSDVYAIWQIFGYICGYCWYWV